MVEGLGLGKITPKPARAITDWAMFGQLVHLEAKFQV
jgi:hypothetical protein